MIFSLAVERIQAAVEAARRSRFASC